MSLTLVTAPTVYPITLAEAKAQCVVEHSDHDDLITAMIAAATDYAEKYTGRDLVQRTWDYSFDLFGSGDIELPKTPVQSVTSVTYTDVTTSPELNTLSTAVYGLDSGGDIPFIYEKYDQYWPDHTIVHNGITVRFVSGYAVTGSPEDYRASIPEGIKAAIKLLVADLYKNREKNTDIQTFDNHTCDMLLNAFRVYR
ncbi:head-tail connector protein [Litorivivens sp.]|uniref:head-tail connector protein n=1 Tax=Litorivivens sp. TaxID=2020868 RepID=UPI0035676B2A